MSMHKNPNTTVGELAILASSVGLVEKSQDGRTAFAAWWAADQAGARKALFARVEARRVAAAKPAPTRKPDARLYPTGWLAAAGKARTPRAARPAKRNRITEAND